MNFGLVGRCACWRMSAIRFSPRCLCSAVRSPGFRIIRATPIGHDIVALRRRQRHRRRTERPRARDSGLEHVSRQRHRPLEDLDLAVLQLNDSQSGDSSPTRAPGTARSYRPDATQSTRACYHLFPFITSCGYEPRGDARAETATRLDEVTRSTCSTRRDRDRCTRTGSSQVASGPSSRGVRPAAPDVLSSPARRGARYSEDIYQGSLTTGRVKRVVGARSAGIAPSVSPTGRASPLLRAAPGAYPPGPAGTARTDPRRQPRRHRPQGDHADATGRASTRTGGRPTARRPRTPRYGPSAVARRSGSWS